MNRMRQTQMTITTTNPTDITLWGIHAGATGDADALFLNHDCVALGGFTVEAGRERREGGGKRSESLNKTRTVSPGCSNIRLLNRAISTKVKLYSLKW